MVANPLSSSLAVTVKVILELVILPTVTLTFGGISSLILALA